MHRFLAAILLGLFLCGSWSCSGSSSACAQHIKAWQKQMNKEGYKTADIPEAIANDPFSNKRPDVVFRNTQPPIASVAINPGAKRQLVCVERGVDGTEQVYAAPYFGFPKKIQ